MLLPVGSPNVQIVAESAVPDTRFAVTGGSNERRWPDKIMPLDCRRHKFHTKMDLKCSVNENKPSPDRIQWTFLVKTET